MTAIALSVRPVGSKYIAVVAIALRQRLNERASLLLRAFMYVMMLAIFSRVWAALVPNPSDYVWYLAVSEWVMLSQPRVYLTIERDVRSGDVACMLTRPMSYVLTKLAEGFGQLIPSLVVLALVGSSSALLLTGRFPREPAGLCAVLVLGVLGSVLWIVCTTLIGVCAFWVHDVNPLYWMWQKAAFVLGGLFVPLELYPGWLQTIAVWSPFSALVNGPASMMLHYDAQRAALLACKLCVYIALAALALRLTWARALRGIELGGG